MFKIIPKSWDFYQPLIYSTSREMEPSGCCSEQPPKIVSKPSTRTTSRGTALFQGAGTVAPAFPKEWMFEATDYSTE